MAGYEPNVSKTTFYDDMNQHANADYRTLGPYIVEAELVGGLYGDYRGYLRVWEAVGDNPDNPDNAFRWVLRGREWYDDPDAARADMNRVAGSRGDLKEWVSEHGTGDQEEFWQKRAHEAEWVNKR
jgi:hypothetical protein